VIASRAPDLYLLCLSTAEVYGAPGHASLPLTEEAPIRPVSPYGSSKAAMEVLVGQYARSYGVRAGVVRAFNQIGPGQAAKFIASSLSRQIAAAELGGGDRVGMVVGNVCAARDFTDIRDSARAYVSIVQGKLTGTYNLCSGTALKIEELIDRMGSHSRLKVEVEVDPALVRKSDPPLIVGSYQHLHDETGWKPRIPIVTTTSDMLDWWREHISAVDPGVRMDRSR
jgi:GDP-4-dehydro-6-deoxy-D-mannose reductase